MAATYTNGLYNGTSVTCQYTIPSHLLAFTEYTYLVLFFKCAVAKTIGEHPLCQVGIIQAKTKKPSWVLLPDFDVTTLVEWHVVRREEDRIDHLAVLKHQLDTKFSSIESQPGWRVTVTHVHGTNVLNVFFVFNHVNFDGQSGKIFHEGLLRNLNHLSNSETPLTGMSTMVSTAATASNMPPPVESMAHFPISPLYAIPTLWKKLAPPFLRSRTTIPPQHAWPPIIANCPVETDLKVVVIPKSVVEGALAACRARNTTMTALLHALTVVSLTLQLPESEMSAMQSVTTIDLRRHIPKMPPVAPGNTELDSRKTMANIVGRLTHRFDPSTISNIRANNSYVSRIITPGKLSDKVTREILFLGVEDIMWSVAAKVRSEIQQRLNMRLRNNELGMMRFADDFRGLVKGTLNRPRVCTFLISNLVLIDGDPADTPTSSTQPVGQDGPTRGRTTSDEGISKWTINRAGFTLSAHVNGAGIHLGVITVKGGDMVIDMTWQKGVVDDKVCEQLGEDLRTWLGHIATQATEAPTP